MEVDPPAARERKHGFSEVGSYLSASALVNPRLIILEIHISGIDPCQSFSSPSPSLVPPPQCPFHHVARLERTAPKLSVDRC